MAATAKLEREITAEEYESVAQAAINVFGYKDAEDALNSLPGIYQSIGKLAMMAKRCKPDSPRGKKLWDQHTALGNKGAETMSIVRFSIKAGALRKATS